MKTGDFTGNVGRCKEKARSVGLHCPQHIATELPKFKSFFHHAK
jgi:hypothetical protein